MKRLAFVSPMKIVKSRLHPSVGFPPDFLELENKISLENDHCVCIRAVNQTTASGRRSPLVTATGSFHCEDTVEFVAAFRPSSGFVTAAIV